MNTISHCANCLYYRLDRVDNMVKCKYPLDCHNKNLFENKETDDADKDLQISKLLQYIDYHGWCGYHGTAYFNIKSKNRFKCDDCYDKDGCERYNILK